MDTFIELEKEKQICINAIKQYNLKYKTLEIKKLYIIYDYLNEQLKIETHEEAKKQIQEDIDIIIEYLIP